MFSGIGKTVFGRVDSTEWRSWNIQQETRAKSVFGEWHCPEAADPVSGQRLQEFTFSKYLLYYIHILHQTSNNMVVISCETLYSRKLHYLGPRMQFLWWVLYFQNLQKYINIFVTIINIINEQCFITIMTGFIK